MKSYEFGWSLDEDKITDITPYVKPHHPNFVWMALQ